MADTTASSPAANCLEKLKSYVRTPKGFILAAEIVSSLGLLTFSFCAAALLVNASKLTAVCDVSHQYYIDIKWSYCCY